jgi:poly-gamma-glutamate capsule biosynthesis protein CapA/YwtB (metallophosphatase superfamily)
VEGGAAVINRDIPQFNRLKTAALRQGIRQIITFGTDAAADVRLVSANYSLDGSVVDAMVYGEPVTFKTTLPGQHVALNMLAVLAAVEAAGGDWRQAADDIASLKTLPNRLHCQRVPFKGHHIDVIDDSFSINPASLKAGLAVAAMVKPGPGGRFIAILGEIHELGRNSPAIHASLAKDVLDAGVDLVYTIGDNMLRLRNALPKKKCGIHSSDPEFLVNAVLKDIKPGDVVFIKGSRRTIDAIARITEALLQPEGDLPAMPDDVIQPLSPVMSPKSIDSETIADLTPNVILDETRSQGRLEVLFVGDTGFGENYQEGYEKKGRGNLLKENGYAYPLELMKDSMLSADIVIANLETPVTNAATSHFDGEKQYIHWADVEETPKHLKEHNIHVVTLANNHTFDYGRAGFVQTLDVLKEKEFQVFGAGRSLSEASRPFIAEAAIGERRFKFAVFSAFEVNTVYREKYKTYADEENGGVCPLVAKHIANEIAAYKRTDPDLYVIVFPHWGPNYQWKTERQSRISDILVEGGADLILGHGAHMLQEVEKRGGRWIAFSLGNFMFNSLGRYKKMKAPPYSLVARIIVENSKDGPAPILRLYPIFTNNRRNGYQTRYTKKKGFNIVMKWLLDKSPDPESLEHETTIGHDHMGYYLELDIRNKSIK